MGWLIRWVVSYLGKYLAQLQGAVEAYEKEKAESEAKIASLKQLNDSLNQQINDQEARRKVLDAQLQTQLQAIDETEAKLKDALAPKPRLVLSDDAELERLSSRNEAP